MLGVRARFRPGGTGLPGAVELEFNREGTPRRFESRPPKPVWPTSSVSCSGDVATGRCPLGWRRHLLGRPARGTVGGATAMTQEAALYRYRPRTIALAREMGNVRGALSLPPASTTCCGVTGSTPWPSVWPRWPAMPHRRTRATEGAARAPHRGRVSGRAGPDRLLPRRAPHRRLGDDRAVHRDRRRQRLRLGRAPRHPAQPLGEVDHRARPTRRQGASIDGLEARALPPLLQPRTSPHRPWTHGRTPAEVIGAAKTGSG